MKQSMKFGAVPAAAVAGTAALFLGSSIASASVIPDADDAGHVVKTISDDLDVSAAIDSNNNGQVDVTVKNSGDQAYECAGLVTEEDVVSRTMDFYTDNLYQQTDATGSLGGLAGLIPIDLDPGSVYQLGGSVTGDTLAEEIYNIQTAQRDAQVDGHSADIETFTVDAKGSGDEEYSDTVSLTDPSNGDRSDFDPAAIVMCTGDDDGWSYAFSTLDSDDGGNGSLASLGSSEGDSGGSMSSMTGSLGSSDGSMGS